MKRLLTILLVFMALSASAQKVAMKTNVLYDASATVNAGGRNWACSANGHWMFQVTSTHGICRADASGNIGSCSPKHAIGFATASQTTFSLYTLMEGSTISVI